MWLQRNPKNQVFHIDLSHLQSGMQALPPAEGGFAFTHAMLLCRVGGFNTQTYVR